MGSPYPPSDDRYRRQLGDGLVLRWSSGADADGIGALYGQVFRGSPEQPINTTIPDWARILLSGRHPLIGSTDFALVEDTGSGAVLAATCLMSQTWQYAGIPIPIGRPEIVASAPSYRNRGLVRAIFELIHARSDARGDLAQGITGIRYYYRQFGYEYALDLGGGTRVPFAAIPALKADESDSVSLREATTADVAQVQALYDREQADTLVSTLIPESYWRFLLEGGMTNEAGIGLRTHLIQNSTGQILGAVFTRARREDDALIVIGFSVGPGVSLLAVLAPVLRALQGQAIATPGWLSGKAPAGAIRFELGRAHPVYQALGERIAPRLEVPYAWYVRVADLPALIRRIAPVLEHRLAGSQATEVYSGELKIEFYRGGLRLAFEKGKLVDSGAYQRPLWWDDAKSNAGFAPLVFLQLLFGHRSLAELKYAFPDVWADDEAKTLLEVLFPPQLARVLALD